MAKSRRRGGNRSSLPSGTLPPASDSPLDVTSDLPGRYTALAAWSSGDALPGPALQYGRAPGTRLPAKQVFQRLHEQRQRKLWREINLLRFYAPAAVKACEQRKRRREVLFARRKAGFSGSARKLHWRRTSYSSYRC